MGSSAELRVRGVGKVGQPGAGHPKKKRSKSSAFKQRQPWNESDIVTLMNGHTKRPKRRGKNTKEQEEEEYTERPYHLSRMTTNRPTKSRRRSLTRERAASEKDRKGEAQK